jgi:hypothetical protein
MGWFNTANAVLQSIKYGTEAFNVLYTSMQHLFQTFGYLLPYNPLPVF